MERSSRLRFGMGGDGCAKGSLGEFSKFASCTSNVGEGGGEQPSGYHTETVQDGGNFSGKRQNGADGRT